MSVLNPVVRHLVPCMDIRTEPRYPGSATLVGVITTLRSTSTPPFPTQMPELCVYAVVTECRAPGAVRIDIEEADTSQIVSRSPSLRAPFPNDPLRVHGLRFRLRNCSFPDAGLYWVKLLFENHVIAQQPILLR